MPIAVASCRQIRRDPATVARGLLGAVLLAVVCDPLAAQSVSGSVIIRGTSVVDPTTGTVTPNRSIVVVQGRIATVGGPATMAPTGARAIDGRGTFAIPGLWDMHAHAVIPGLAETIFPTNIANGITGIREMFGVTTDALKYRSDVTAGRMVGPRFVFAGNIVNGWPPTRPGEVVVRSPAEGRRAVDSLVDARAEFIKVYSLLDSASFDAIATQARVRRIPLAGHVPLSVSAVHAATMGQKSAEHLEGITAGCAAGENDLVDAAVLWLRSRVTDSANAPSLLSEMNRRVGPMTATYDVARCDALLRKLASLGMWQVPTLGVLRAVSRLSDPALVRTERTKYLPPMLQQMWRGMSACMDTGADTSRRNFHRDIERGIVRRMAALDVPLLAGTDSPNLFSYPGFGVHDELERLVSAGLTPLQALRAATFNPAVYFAASDSMGTIARGKVADIVLLDANPLLEIGNTRRIRAVIAQGRVFDRGALDALLVEVARVNTAPSPTPPPDLIEVLPQCVP